MYGSPYRNYNRGGGGGGFGRGQPRRFQPPPPQPPPRKGDVFEEAGRLAAEYLVSKGLLPPNALSGKWQNGSFKNQDFQFLRAQEGDNLLESRTSVLSRLGDASDAGSGSGRRRLVDDFNPNGLRDYMKGRRRTGSFKGYDSEGNREFGRSGSWYDKARVSPDMEGGDNAFPGNVEEHQTGSCGSIEEQKSLPSSEAVLKNDSAGNSESEFQKNQVSENVDFNASSSSTTGIDIPPETAVVSKESGDALKTVQAGTTEANDGSNNDESEKLSVQEDITIQHYAEEDDPANNGGSDLLALSRFAKVPTRTRSSLTVRGSKIDPVLIAEDEDPNESELSRESGGPVEDVCTDVSLGDGSLNQSHSLKYIELPEASAEQDARQLGLTYKVGQGICRRSESFPERSFMREVESSEAELGFGRSSSMILERREKRALQHSDSGEGAKRLREWNPTDSQTEDFVHLSNSMEKQQTSEGRPSSEQAILDADQHKMMDISMFPDSGTEPCIEHAEEKQLFPGSFKICDLNLMEASDVHENHVADSVLMFQSIPQIKKEAERVDIDLSMSSNGNATDKNGMRGADGKEVEVIDLESDSVQKDKAFNNSEQKEETIFTGLESFPDQAQGVNEIPDGQDGYGLMISELLGADIPNCSPVQPDINSMHNEMGIHNEEGILGDDDSIYMSLGEIPISFLRVWDQQPAQEYEKPF